jgi:murein DD-endopeptidase MepM/ murein hydrolase activator NlpD
VLAAGVIVPARADTASELQDARARLAELRDDLNAQVAAWQAAEAQLARSRDEAAALRAEIGELGVEFREAQRTFDLRAQELFMSGGDPTFVALLTAGSATEVADRWEFANQVALGDQHLATRVAAQTERMRWLRARLAEAIDEEMLAADRLQATVDGLEGKVSLTLGQISDLQKELRQEQQLAAVSTGGGGVNVTGSGAIQTCPVAGPNSFVDSFGDPRSGGRTHEGIDMIAARGTPVVAVHSGRVHRTSSSIGGLGIVVFHDGSSDWTFYTHFDSYAQYGEGAHVSAGTVIGYVGNTGTTTYHLHFEYHPGGGAAVNPYSALVSVCR